MKNWPIHQYKCRLMLTNYNRPFCYNYQLPPRPKAGKSVTELFATALTDAGINTRNVSMVDSGAAKIGGVTFTSSVWQTSTADGPFQSLKE